MDYYCNIEHAVETLKNGKSRNKRCSLLIGAGCSVTAGIPTAEGFVNIISERYHQCFERAVEKTYPKCMAELPPGQRKSLIREFVDKAKINWTHLCIGQLMKEGYVDRVLTVNFDLSIVRACALLGIFPSVYDFASSQAFKPAEITDNAVFYLHGQYTGFVLMNTEKEVEEHSKRLSPVFEDAQRGRTWIVCGYSGDNDPVFDHLSKVPCFDDNLYWIGYEKNPPSEHVRLKLLRDNKYAFYIQEYDSDRFFITLTQKLSCFPPKIFTNPFSHIKNIFDSFTPFPILSSDVIADHKIDFTTRTKNMISSAIKSFEVKSSKRKLGLTQVLLNVTRATDLFMLGNYEGVIKLKNKIKPDKNGRDLLYWSEVELGNIFSVNDESIKNKVKQRLLEKAITHYRKACLFHKSPSVALNNWGLSLFNLAKTDEQPRKQFLLEESILKYKEVIKFESDYFIAYGNWGNSLYELSRIKDDLLEKESLLKDAIDKYQTAIRINRNHHLSYNNAATSLLELAKINMDRKEREKILFEGLKFVREAEKILPGYGSYNMACIYSLLGNSDACRLALEKSNKYSFIPKCDHLISDTDLDNVRVEGWFKDLIKEICG